MAALRASTPVPVTIPDAGKHIGQWKRQLADGTIIEVVGVASGGASGPGGRIEFPRVFSSSTYDLASAAGSWNFRMDGDAFSSSGRPDAHSGTSSAIRILLRQTTLNAFQHIIDEQHAQVELSLVGVRNIDSTTWRIERGEAQLLQKLRSGDIDFVITSTANASTLAPQAGVFSLHFIFRDQAHLAKALADPAIAAEFRALIKDQVQGAQVLGLLTMGLRNMYSKQEVRSVDDIKGKKVRVQATKTEDTHFPAYGAQTVHMPFGDVYTSLQTGVVNVAENGINVYLANKHYEVAPILSITEHEANNNCIWVSDKTWNSLTPEQQRWVQAAADEVSKTEPAMALKLEKDSADKLKSIGVKVVENVDKSGFMKAATPVQDQLAAELGPHAVKLLKMVRELK